MCTIRVPGGRGGEPSYEKSRVLNPHYFDSLLAFVTEVNFASITIACHALLFVQFVAAFGYLRVSPLPEWQ